MLVLLAFSLFALQVAEQHPLSVVVQPPVYHLVPKIDTDLSFADAAHYYNREEIENAENQLICKSIQYVDATLFNVIPPSTLQRSTLSPTQEELSDLNKARYFLTVPPSGFGVGDVPPGGSFSPPAPPMMAAMCVSVDSPRPFPVLFAPPPPRDAFTDNDFRGTEPQTVPKEVRESPVMEAKKEIPLEISLHFPIDDVMNMNVKGVRATIENSSSSRSDSTGTYSLKIPRVSPKVEITYSSRMTDSEPFKLNQVLDYFGSDSSKQPTRSRGSF